MTKELVFVFYTKIPEKISLYHKLQLKAIRWWTGSDVFHVEVVIDDKYIAATTSGVVVNELREFSDKYKYISLKLEASEKHHKEIKDWIFSLSGSKYDWKAIWWRQFINLGAQKTDQWICSEITNKILQLYMVEPFVRTESTDISPGEIYDELLKIGEVRTSTGLNSDRGL